MLTTEQLAQCNANLPAATLQIDPRVAAQVVRPQIGLPPTAVITGGASTSAPSATPPPPTQVAIEPGGRPEDMRVWALSGSTIRYYGTTARLPAPALPEARRIVSGRIEVPALTLQASAPGATPTPRSSVVRPPDFFYGPTGAVMLRVPISMRDLPEDALGLGLRCSLSRGRYVPRPIETSPHVALSSMGTGAEESFVALGSVELQITNINRWETTVDIPMVLRPFQRLEDARSYDCAIRMFVDRVSPPGREQLMLVALVDPASSSSRAPYRPAAGTTPQLYVRGNIQ